MEIAEISRRVSRSCSHVINRLKLLDLAPSVQKLVAEGTLSASSAVILVTLGNHEAQRQIAKKAADEKLLPEGVRGLVQLHKESAKAGKGSA